MTLGVPHKKMPHRTVGPIFRCWFCGNLSDLSCRTIPLDGFGGNVFPFDFNREQSKSAIRGDPFSAAEIDAGFKLSKKRTTLECSASLQTQRRDLCIHIYWLALCIDILVSWQICVQNAIRHALLAEMATQRSGASFAYNCFFRGIGGDGWSPTAQRRHAKWLIRLGN